MYKQKFDPCFNFNSDRFCCSERGDKLRRQVRAGEMPYSESNYMAPRNNDPNDMRSLETKQVGLIDPTPYNFAPVKTWHTWCGKLPCSTDNKDGVPPCQKYMPFCTRQQ